KLFRNPRSTLQRVGVLQRLPDPKLWLEFDPAVLEPTGRTRGRMGLPGGIREVAGGIRTRMADTAWPARNVTESGGIGGKRRLSVGGPGKKRGGFSAPPEPLYSGLSAPTRWWGDTRDSVPTLSLGESILYRCASLSIYPTSLTMG